MPRLALCLAVLVMVFTVSGCRGLNKEFNFDLEGDPQKITVDPIDRDQTIKVNVKATGGPVDVFVYLARDSSTANQINPMPKDQSKILQKALKTESATLEVPIPASNAAVIQVNASTGKAAKVTVKLTN
jgi:hypothetical protein